MPETFFHRSKLLVAMAAVLAACVVNATSVVVELDSVAYVSPPPGNSIDFSASTATWVYDTATGVLTGSGLLSMDALFTPTTNIFEFRTVDPVFTVGNIASASSFTCIEGGFGVTNSSHSCGGWDFGPNSINESSITYGPGTSFTRTIGGDDVSNVSPVSISHFDNMPANWNGTTLVFSNTKVAAAGLAYDITFTAVQILATFNDVPTDHWAFTFIEALADSGITAGCGNNNYCPSSPVTRAQMAVFLERGIHGSGFSPPAASGNVFLDVGANDFAASFIEQFFLDGITAGCGNNSYCPDAEVTRAQMAVFLLRAKHGSSYSPPPAMGIFDDVPLSHWAVHWIEQLAAEGITAGCDPDNYCPDNVVTRDQMAVFLVRTFGLQSAEQCATDGKFNYATALNGTNSTLTASIQNFSGSGDVTVNGADTAALIAPFTFDWGDNTETIGWFPQEHSYSDISQNYIVMVTSHYSDQTTDEVLLLVRFQPPVVVKKIDKPALAVTIPNENISLGTRLYFPPTLSHFDDSFFLQISREIVEYVLTVAADMQYEYMNQDVFLIDGGFNQMVLLDASLGGGMYSLWYTNPVAFGAGPTAFSGTLPYSSFFHEMGHNVTLNSPAIFYYGGKIDGPANAIFSETMAQIVAHVTAYDIVNQGAGLGLSCDLVFDIRQDALRTARFLRQQFDNYVNGGMPFASWNVPATPIDETFGTFMTLAYVFLNHAQVSGAGFAVPLQRMMTLLQNTENVSLILSVRNTNSPEADSIRATLMVAAISYAFEGDLSGEFQALNFPVDQELHDQLYSAAP